MSRRQLSACAARLPSDKAALFLALMSAADAQFMRSVESRRMAWDLYHSLVPPELRTARAGKRATVKRAHK